MIRVPLRRTGLASPAEPKSSSRPKVRRSPSEFKNGKREYGSLIAIRAKHFEYWISLDEGGNLTADGTPMTLGEEISAEHLLLAGLARCSISSLAYFARQQGVEARASALASGTVTRREEDDRYAFVTIECQMDVKLEPEPGGEQLRGLVESAEWGCFVGASLKPAPQYTWRVNGRPL